MQGTVLFQSFQKDVHAEANLVPACRRCNHYKRARTPKQFRELMATLHECIESISIMKVAIDFGIAEVKPFDGKFYFENLKPEPKSCS